ncbi:hypothetical protein HGA64_03010 [Candidatus Falkowbacteria bacterium]|nr:hypothetical protein [Candidatus Falkowbacteria bacterium]
MLLNGGVHARGKAKDDSRQDIAVLLGIVIVLIVAAIGSVGISLHERSVAVFKPVSYVQ